MKKTIKSNEINGFISAQQKSANSLTFCGQLPENVKATGIKIVGKIEINGNVYEDTYIENLEGAVVQYHKCDEEIATVYFLEGLPENLRTDILNTVISDFELECIEVCPCCGG